MLLDRRRRAEGRASGEEWDVQDCVSGQLHANIVIASDGVDRCAVNALDRHLLRIEYAHLNDVTVAPLDEEHEQIAINEE